MSPLLTIDPETDTLCELETEPPPPPPVFDPRPCKVGTFILLFLRCCWNEIPCEDFLPTNACLPVEFDDVV